MSLESLPLSGTQFAVTQGFHEPVSLSTLFPTVYLLSPKTSGTQSGTQSGEGTHACHPSTLEVKAEGAGIQAHPWLLEDTLGYTRPCLKKTDGLEQRVCG